MKKPGKTWAGGDQYEAYVGRWSRLVARDFLNWLGAPPHARWLDVGCGTGALSGTIVATASPEEVLGIDPAKSLLNVAKRVVQDERVRFELGKAEDIPSESGRFDVVVSGLVLNFIPDLEAAMSEMIRAGKRHGLIAAYVWDYAGKMELMRYFWDAAVELRPQDAHHDEGLRFPICRPDVLESTFIAAGLESVEVVPIDVPTRFADFQDYWSPFHAGHFPAPEYAMSLSESDRAALRGRLQQTLPFEQDGSLNLIARAWGVRGRIPEA